MNLLLFAPEQRQGGTRVEVGREHAQHLRKVLRVGPGASVRVGELGGRLGTGVLRELERDRAVLEVVLDGAPPPPSHCRLALALPRPPVFARVLRHVTSMGIKHIEVFDSARVESSYWTSHALEPEAVARELHLGLEQGGDTIRPAVSFHRSFDAWCQGAAAGEDRELWVADVGHPPPRTRVDPPCMLVVGPEGGFVAAERERFAGVGANFVGLGPRPLRVEVAVVALWASLGL